MQGTRDSLFTPHTVAAQGGAEQPPCNLGTCLLSMFLLQYTLVEYSSYVSESIRSKK